MIALTRFTNLYTDALWTLFFIAKEEALLEVY